MNPDETKSEIRELSSAVRHVFAQIALSLVALTALLVWLPADAGIPSWVIHTVTVTVFFGGFGCGYWFRGWAKRIDRA